MKPIPVSFNIWKLKIHTYGIGLAITFWFAFRYFERRLRKFGYPWQWLGGAFVWIIVAAIVGARAVHVLANLSYYTSDPGQVLAVWNGGLSSFGGLIGGVPTGLILARRRCPSLPTIEGARHRVARAHGGVGRGTSARSPADDRRRRPPYEPVVRHVLRRRGRQAAAGPHLPVDRVFRDLRDPDPHREARAAQAHRFHPFGDDGSMGPVADSQRNISG